MGGKQSVPAIAYEKFSDNELAHIEQVFRDYGEIHRTKESFIDRKTFISYFMPKSPELAELVFDAFDLSGNGKLNFSEFASGLALCARGTHEEKLKFLFDIFDADKNGAIDRVEMQTLFERAFKQANTCLRASGCVEPHNEHEAKMAATRLVKKAFVFDKDESGHLTLSQFKEWAASEYEVSRLLCRFRGFEVFIVPVEEQEISGPTNVQHTTHIGGSDGTFDLKDIPPDWRRAMKDAGVKKSELRDPETVKWLLSVIAKHAPPLPARTEGAAVVAPPLPARTSSETSQPPQQQQPAGDVATPPSAPAVPPAPPAVPATNSTPPAAPAVSASPLADITKFDKSKLSHVSSNKRRPAGRNPLLVAIESGPKLHHVDPADINLDKMSPEQRGDLNGILARAIASRRGFLLETLPDGDTSSPSSSSESDWDDSDWDDDDEWGDR